MAYARVPFTDHPERYKIRPVIVVSWSQNGQTVEVRPLTSRVNTDRDHVLLEHWPAAGLSRPCAVQPRAVHIDRGDFQGVIGRLHPDDTPAVEALCEQGP